MSCIVRYLCDRKRHLICEPYSVAGLHAMALALRIPRSWFHRGRHPHYDIPKTRIDEIAARCEVVSPREIVRIIQGKLREAA
ncbi:MAG TPA: DUF4031 domain-containing protein [Rhizomicrobium sp.]|jgi:hypothetical protein